MAHTLLIGMIVALAAAGFWRYNNARNDSASSNLGEGVMFDRIAGYYDSVNGVMSLGLHLIWKDILVQNLDLRTGANVLDLACGTGDVSIKMVKHLKEKGGVSAVTCYDPSTNMLSMAKSKVDAEEDVKDFITLKKGFAEDLNQFEDHSFDRVSISFGIRNFANRGKALGEIYKKLTTTGKLGILEFVAPTEGLLKGVVNTFLIHVLPFIGSLSSGGMTHEYQHLRDSIQTWASPTDFLRYV